MTSVSRTSADPGIDPSTVSPSVPPDSAERGESSDSALSLRVRRPAPGVVVLEASGVLDDEHEARFAEVLRHRMNCTARTVLLDVSGLRFMDTAGAVTMLEAATVARFRDKRLRVISGPAADRLLASIEVADRFTYVEHLDDVLATATPQQARVPARPEAAANRAEGQRA